MLCICMLVCVCAKVFSAFRGVNDGKSLLHVAAVKNCKNEIKSSPIKPLIKLIGWARCFVSSGWLLLQRNSISFDWVTIFCWWQQRLWRWRWRLRVIAWLRELLGFLCSMGFKATEINYENLFKKENGMGCAIALIGAPNWNLHENACIICHTKTYICCSIY